MYSCFTNSIFAARTLDFKVKFWFVFRSEPVVFRRYVLALLSVGLLRKFEAYLVYLSLIRSYSLGAFHFFKNSSILLICYYGFALSSPDFPRKLMTCAVVFQLCHFNLQPAKHTCRIFRFRSCLGLVKSSIFAWNYLRFLERMFG